MPEENLGDSNVTNEELRTLVTIKEILQKDYEEIGDIVADYQELTTVRTSLDSSESKTEDIAHAIEKDGENILKSKELKSISNIDSYEINVRYKDEKV
ncbi:hypothetical protein CR203_15040 [Salipaludibacillus neizhouensis]|uniref:Uncharacterized protein n=1 Tax=Salipaludibacillus neizhouensis TaxID=885475 RepID=A0A3A9K2M5_9BACI|nr:hypothetical protein [Salipaludibacillus neizhouensis]RKL66599.1 hypothetical protein CR203_15040 [Salipaludibacillus neizhouensis]